MSSASVRSTSIICSICGKAYKGNSIYAHSRKVHGISYTVKSKRKVDSGVDDPEVIKEDRLEQLRKYFMTGKMEVCDFKRQEAEIIAEYEKSLEQGQTKLNLDITKLIGGDNAYTVEYLGKLPNIAELMTIAASGDYGRLFVKVVRGHASFSESCMIYKGEMQFYREEILVKMYNTICNAMSLMIAKEMEKTRIEYYDSEVESELRHGWDIPNDAFSSIQGSITIGKRPLILSSIKEEIALGHLE